MSIRKSPSLDQVVLLASEVGSDAIEDGLEQRPVLAVRDRLDLPFVFLGDLEIFEVRVADLDVVALEVGLNRLLFLLFDPSCLSWRRPVTSMRSPGSA